MRNILILSAAVSMLAGAASAQNATGVPAPAAKPSFLSHLHSSVMKKATPTSSTKTTTTSAQAAPKAVATTSHGKPRTAQSIACSDKANTQNIHGADRKKFMASCKKGG